MKRFVFRLGLALLALPVIAVLAFYGHENWTGHQEWLSVNDYLATRGEPLTLDDIAAKPVPDEDNLAAAPIFREFLTAADPSQSALSAIRLPPELTEDDDPAADTPDELAALARRFRADFAGSETEAVSVIRAGIAPMEGLLGQLAEATARPATVWPRGTQVGFKVSMPFLEPLLQVSEVLAARAVMALAGKDPQSARDDFDLILNLARRANQPSLLISALAEQVMLQRAVGVARAGLAAGAWTTSDLVHIQRELSAFTPLVSLAQSLRHERVMFLEHTPELTAKAAPYFRLVDRSNALAEFATRVACNLAWNLRPSGWDHRDRAQYADMVQLYIDGAIPRGKVLPDFVDAWMGRMHTIRKSPFQFFRTPLTVLALPAFNNVARRAAYTQAQLDLTVAACAIERFRLTHGHVPPSLADLTPNFHPSSPTDVIRGGPLNYRTENATTYLLYSIGWNGRDDGGLATIPSTPSRQDPDWTWTSSAASP